MPRALAEDGKSAAELPSLLAIEESRRVEINGISSSNPFNQIANCLAQDKRDLAHKPLLAKQEFLQKQNRAVRLLL